MEMIESREMGKALAEIGKVCPARSATSGAFILVWFTAYCCKINIAYFDLKAKSVSLPDAEHKWKYYL